MTTRQRRFFVMLVHLLGVSLPTYNTKHQYAGRGVSATWPVWPVALERIKLYNHPTDREDKRRRRRINRREASASEQPRRNERRRRRRRRISEADESSSPLWLQNTRDGSCLGPLGTFSECGDATLWWMERYTLPPSYSTVSPVARERRRLLSGTPPLLGNSAMAAADATLDGDLSLLHGYVFRVVDFDASLSVPLNATEPVVRSDPTIGTTPDCLRAGSIESNRRSNQNATSFLEIAPCPPTRLTRARWWKKRTPMAHHSVLWRITPDGHIQHASFNKREVEWKCLAQSVSSSNQAVLVDCDHGDFVPVQFALFRYRPVAVSTLKSKSLQQSNARQYLSDERKHQAESSDDPLLHPELKVASQLIFDLRPKSPVKAASQGSFLHRVLTNSNPFLMALQPSIERRVDRLVDDFPAIDEGALKLRRMQSHPYLVEAKNGIWTDPQTGLTFHTDLCRYLGRNCNEQGRHTLTGMGIYRKGYVIKVYGIAYYVSKRDVLVNPSMERYATLTAEQLRTRPDFYEMLRKVGHFDRTIMLKTNMQLSAETMRSSLQADWSYLTEEAKSTLVGVSMNARPADEAMLKLIQSPDNPSRCSCSQTAPPEFNANPDCCARGTELVFTWTKTNDLEVRLNGRLMEAFPRPDIAEGIFYEYLRYDDPISPELLDRVVDGFPFLLGPIAGINGQMMASPSESAENHFQAVMESMTAMKDTFVLQAMDFGDSVKRSASDAADHAGNAAKAFGLAAKELAVEADRRRDLLVKHTVAAPTVLMKLLERDEETIQSFSQWMYGEVKEPEIPELEVEALRSSDHRLSRGRIFGYTLSRWYGEDYYAPDEIGPMRIHPTINKFFLTLVHLYLLLLFIVSFPGSHSTRTRLVSRKSAFAGQDISDSESDISEDNDKMSLDASMELDPQSVKAMYGTRGFLFSHRNAIQRTEKFTTAPSTESGFRKKSLSYFL